MFRLICFGLISLGYLHSIVANPATDEDCRPPLPPGCINHYASVTAFGCGNSLTVNSTTGFSTGQQVLIIQMMGAQTDLFEGSTTLDGRIINLRGAGRFEYNKIQSITDSSIVFDRQLRTDYNLDGKIQLVSVPNLGNTVIGNLTCPRWDEGAGTGGVLAFSGGNLTLSDTIDVSGKGFQGGVVREFDSNDGCAGSPLAYYPGDSHRESVKGKGISCIPFQFLKGRGRTATGGGGGDPHNAGSGGGGNFGAGGDGGLFQKCSGNQRARGGQKISDFSDRLTMGGGAGGVHSNNGRGIPGGDGGGIVFIKANSIDPTGNQHPILANGTTNSNPFYLSNNVKDGGGGGGAGGSVFISLSGQTIPLHIEARGGAGADVQKNHGAGGGGGGGLITSTHLLPNGSVLDVSGGIKGVAPGSNPGFDARNGESGETITDANLPTGAPFIPPTLLNYTVTTRCDSSSTVQVDAIGTNITITLGGIPTTFTNGLFRDVRSGTYTIAVTNGCTSESIDITVVNYPELSAEIILEQPLICERLGAIEVVPRGGKPPFTFTLVDGEPTTNGYFGGLPEGQHPVLITDDLGCTHRARPFVEDSSYIIEVIFPDSIIEQRATTYPLPDSISTPYPPLQFEWSPSESFNSPNSQDPEIRPRIFNEDVRVWVTDNVGCTGAGTLLIRIKDPDFYVPNAVRPGRDGPNGVFGLYAHPALQGRIVSAQITDRWGNRIWCMGDPRRNPKNPLDSANECVPPVAITDATRLWDPLTETQFLNTGVYIYTFLIEIVDGKTFSLEGSFILAP